MDASVLSSRITAYIRETPGVRNVEDVQFEVSGRKLLYECTVQPILYFPVTVSQITFLIRDMSCCSGTSSVSQLPGRNGQA